MRRRTGELEAAACPPPRASPGSRGASASAPAIAAPRAECEAQKQLGPHTQGECVALGCGDAAARATACMSVRRLSACGAWGRRMSVTAVPWGAGHLLGTRRAPFATESRALGRGNEYVAKRPQAANRNLETPHLSL